MISSFGDVGAFSFVKIYCYRLSCKHVYHQRGRSRHALTRNFEIASAKWTNIIKA